MSNGYVAYIYIYINLYMCLGKNLFKGVCKRLQTVPQSRTEDWRLKAWEKLLQSRVLDWRFLGSRSFPQAFNLQSWIEEFFLRSSICNIWSETKPADTNVPGRASSAWKESQLSVFSQRCKLLYHKRRSNMFFLFKKQF